MRVPKTTTTRTVTRKAVSKALAAQDSKRKRSPEELQRAISLKAYDLYVQRGCVNGFDKEDWMIAEQIILSADA